MEKFAVDLDKVLDDFELNEDRAERFAAKNKSPQPKHQQALLGRPLSGRVANKRENYPRPEGSERLRRINLVDADFAPDPNPVSTIRVPHTEQEDAPNVRSSKINAYAIQPDQSQNSYSSGSWQQHDEHGIYRNSLLVNTNVQESNSDVSGLPYSLPNFPGFVDGIPNTEFSPKERGEGNKPEFGADEELILVSNASSAAPSLNKVVVAPECRDHGQSGETQWDSGGNGGVSGSLVNVSGESSYQNRESSEEKANETTSKDTPSQSVLISLSSSETTEDVNSIKGLESDSIGSFGNQSPSELSKKSSSDRPVNLKDKNGDLKSVPLDVSNKADLAPSDSKDTSKSEDEFDECVEEKDVISSSLRDEVSDVAIVKPVRFQIDEELSDADVSKYLAELEEEEQEKGEEGRGERVTDTVKGAESVNPLEVEGGGGGDGESEVNGDCLRLSSDGEADDKEIVSRDFETLEGRQSSGLNLCLEESMSSVQSEEQGSGIICKSSSGDLPMPGLKFESDPCVDYLKQNLDDGVMDNGDKQCPESGAACEEQSPKDVRKHSVDSREESWVVEGSGKLLESAAIDKVIDTEDSEMSSTLSKQISRTVPPVRPDSLSIVGVVTSSGAISSDDPEDDPIPIPYVIGPPGATPANPKPPSEMILTQTEDESLRRSGEEMKAFTAPTAILAGDLPLSNQTSSQLNESGSSGCIAEDESSVAGTDLPELSPPKSPGAEDSTPSSSSSGGDREQEVGEKGTTEEVSNEDSSLGNGSPEDPQLSSPHPMTQDPEGFQLPSSDAEVPHDDSGCGALALGDVAPFWVPDADAPVCMSCAAKFTLIKRRHHCRACGKVLCSKCCSSRARLAYMDHSEARVCAPCQSILQEALAASGGNSPPGSGRHNQYRGPGDNEGGVTSEHSPRRRLASGRPDPNNPMEYCSTVPPMEQVGERACAPPPSVMVPVGVLKREGSSSRSKGETKQVMFSDGIRPGGDLTDLDRSPNALSAPSKCSQGLSTIQRKIASRLGKRVLGAMPPGPGPICGPTTQLPPVGSSRIPGDALPPMIDTSTGGCVGGGEFNFEDGPDLDRLRETLTDESEPPVAFALSKNFFVLVKIITLDCCVNRVVWSFTTRGMRCVGQDEVVVLLEWLPTDKGPPRDIFCHLGALHEQASKGNTVTELGHSTVQGQFLGSHNHGGFLYIRATFQCLRRLPLPPPPYLFGLLLHRMETPWAKVFPIRVMLRLGAEFRYYPCPLVGIRGRDPVYQQIGHTIMNLLSDFRNFAYILPSVRGMVIHMEERRTSILLPKNRLSQVERALDDSDDHVLALAASFSSAADSHLVCVQGETGDASTGSNHYHTQAINIQNKPRKVTGASFVVFNGALKASAKLTAKSSIVEDGLMVQVLPDTLTNLRTALRNGEDFVIPCGPVSPVTPSSEVKDGSSAPQPDEVVVISWVDDDKNFNIGVKSPIDGLALDGVPSIRVHNGTNYVSDTKFIRWTEVFLIQSIETAPSGRGDTMDVSRISESIAHAACLAFHPNLDLLWSHALTLIAVRATLGPDSEGYEAGSGGSRLPPIYMNGLDNELVGVLHRIESRPQEGNLVLELLFHVMEL